MWRPTRLCDASHLIWFEGRSVDCLEFNCKFRFGFNWTMNNRQATGGCAQSIFYYFCTVLVSFWTSDIYQLVLCGEGDITNVGGISKSIIYRTMECVYWVQLAPLLLVVVPQFKSSTARDVLPKAKSSWAVKLKWDMMLVGERGRIGKNANCQITWRSSVGLGPVVSEVDSDVKVTSVQIEIGSEHTISWWSFCGCGDSVGFTFSTSVRMHEFNLSNRSCGSRYIA